MTHEGVWVRELKPNLRKSVRIVSHELQNRRALLTLLVLLLAVPVLPIRLVNATDYSVSPTLSGDFLSQYYPGTNDGSAAAETKLSQDSASQTGTTMYGPNNPIIYSGIQAELNGQSGCATICYLDNIKITVTITDSSGTILSGSRITNLGMLVSPADPNNGGTDWVAIFTDLANFLLGVKGLPSIPNFSDGIAPVPSGTGSDTSSAWAMWKNALDSGWHVTAKGINFRYQPNFPSPDVYTITVQSQAEMWLATVEAFVKDTTVSLSNSFQYVYESDANSGNDAGKDFSTATGITLGSYNGFGYGADTVDMYKFDGHQGQTIYYNLAAPSSADFGVAFYDPSWNPISGAGGDPGTGGNLYGSFIPSTTGSYYEKIYLASGSGTYSFALSTSPIPPDFSISPSTLSLCVYPGTLNGAYVTMHSLNGLSGNIVMTNSLQPYNVRVWTYFSYPTTGDTTITVSISSGGIAYVGFQVGAENNSFAQGTYTLTITGTQGSLSHSTSMQVTVSYSSCPPP